LRRRKESGEGFDELEALRAKLGDRIVHQEMQGLRAWVRGLQFVNVQDAYLQLFRDPRMLGELVGAGAVPADWPEICRDTLGRLQGGTLPQEDATPFLYLEELLRGAYVNLKVRHLVVDEAQDYSPLQLDFLRHLFPEARLTLLGDPHQAVSPGLSCLTETRELAASAKPEEIALMQLTQTYRSTREIVEFTRGLLPEGEEIVPFDRHGETPRLVRASSREHLAACIAEDIARLEQAGLATIAILCKTAGESEECFAALQPKLPVQLIGKDATAFSRGVLIMPGYLAKGLEFDAVIIFDASDGVYADEHDRRLLYGACTRAMHSLHVYAAGSLSKLLEPVDKRTYASLGC
jgi:DNA helicase-2/ATP-dependent DNA helicase PcrA